MKRKNIGSRPCFGLISMLFIWGCGGSEESLSVDSQPLAAADTQPTNTLIVNQDPKQVVCQNISCISSTLGAAGCAWEDCGPSNTYYEAKCEHLGQPYQLKSCRCYTNNEVTLEKECDPATTTDAPKVMAQCCEFPVLEAATHP